jgi:predicted DNA-binding protein (MmcQ/YjbR family)
MTYDDVVAFCLRLPGAWTDTPWEGGGNVVKVGPKVFVFPGDGTVSIKVLPEAGDELRAAYPQTVGSAPYLSRKHWVQVAMDGTMPDDELCELIEESYRLVVRGLTKAQREALA